MQGIEQMSRSMIVCNNKPIIEDHTINFYRAIHSYTNSEQGMTAYAALLQHLATENYALVVATAYW